MVFTLSKELIHSVIENKKYSKIKQEQIIVKDNNEEKYILKYNAQIVVFDLCFISHNESKGNCKCLHC